MAIATEGTFKVQLPSVEDDTALQTFMTDLEMHKGTRGVKKLLDTLRTLRSHKELVEKQYTQAQRTADFINGVRDYSSLGGKTKGLRATARRYFDGLATPALRKQCEFYGVDYDAYDTTEGRLEALIDRYMADTIN